MTGKSKVFLDVLTNLIAGVIVLVAIIPILNILGIMCSAIDSCWITNSTPINNAFLILIALFFSYILFWILKSRKASIEKSEIIERQSKTIEKSGIFQLKEQFHPVTFNHYISEAKEIYILNTFVPNLEALKPQLVDAISKNINIRILLLNPNCPETQYRAETLGIHLNDIKTRIRDSIKFLQEEIYNRVDKPKLLELKLYESLAPFSLYSTNRGSLIGFYMNNMLAVAGPQLVISTEHDLFVKFREQFDYIWRNAKEFKLDENDWKTVVDRMRC